MMRVPFPLLLGAVCLAVWPAWHWFVVGSMDGSNEATGLLAAGTAALLAWRAPALAEHGKRPRFPLYLPLMLLATYAAASASGLPVALTAILAACAIAALVSSLRFGTRLDFAFAALCLLALPLSASLQFYCGYPLRVMAGHMALMLLRLNGLEVLREGAMLAWEGKLVAVDAPCSGIKMLWAGLYLACALAAADRLGMMRTIAALVCAVLIVIAANAMRAAGLFYMEAGILPLPAWCHAGIGVVCFGGAAAAVYATSRALRRETA